MQTNYFLKLNLIKKVQIIIAVGITPGFAIKCFFQEILCRVGKTTGSLERISYSLD